MLRIDIQSEYENEASLAELLNIADLFFYDVKPEMFITKAMPEATQRIGALVKSGYAPHPMEYEHYYIKRRPEIGA